MRIYTHEEPQLWHMSARKTPDLLALRPEEINIGAPQDYIYMHTLKSVSKDLASDQPETMC